MLESEMMNNGFEYLKELKNFQAVKQEIPFLSRCIDVVLLDRNNKIISIEFKVSKWRHAIEQAVNHKLGADKAYICLPKRNITKKLSSALEESGVGLLTYDNDCDEKIKIAIPAPEQSSNIEAFKTLLLYNFNKV